MERYTVNMSIRHTVNMLNADSAFDWGSVRSLNTSDDISEEIFEQVAQVVSDTIRTRRASVTRSERLQLYGLYKQATLGNERPERPGKFFFEARLKVGCMGCMRRV